MSPLRDTIAEPPFTMLELEHLVRITRMARDEWVERKLQMQERELMIGNGHVREAILAAENEVYILTNIVTKLWRMLNPPPGSVPPMPGSSPPTTLRRP